RIKRPASSGTTWPNLASLALADAVSSALPCPGSCRDGDLCDGSSHPNKKLNTRPMVLNTPPCGSIRISTSSLLSIDVLAHSLGSISTPLTRTTTGCSSCSVRSIPFDENQPSIVPVHSWVSIGAPSIRLG